LPKGVSPPTVNEMKVTLTSPNTAIIDGRTYKFTVNQHHDVIELCSDATIIDALTIEYDKKWANVVRKIETLLHA